MRARFFLLSATLLFLSVSVKAQHLQPDAEGSLVKWLTLSEAMEKVKTQPKPIIIDFYTDWCGWCKKMMKTTYANQDLAQYINMNFYPVKFNAETKDTVEYLGQKYAPSSDAPRAANNLAIKLLQGKLSYPSTLFLNLYDKQKNEFTFSMLSQGYMETKRIEPMLVFQLENVFRNSSFEDFEKEYYRAFYDSVNTEKFMSQKWFKPSNFFGRQDSATKKTIVLINTDWCNSCRVMKRTLLADSSNGKYLNEKFHWVDFNPETTDPITFKGQTFINTRTQQMPFHQLAVALCKNNLTLPTLVVLDEKLNLLDAIPYYLNPKSVKDVAQYFGDDIYKNKSWADYMNLPQKQ